MLPSFIRRLAFALGVTVTAQGCMTAPNNHQQVCGANATVQFSGYVPWANRAVVLQAASSSNGPWTTLGTAVSGASGYAYGGLTHYPFSKLLQIPSWSSTDSTLHAYLRARVNTATNGDQAWQNLTTFDVTPPTGANWLQCITTRVNAGDNLNAALGYCASPQSPVVEITAPSLSTCGCSETVHDGDLTIDDAPSAAQAVCLQALNGSLTVTEGAPEVLPLPALVTITGNATLDYSYPFQQGTSTLRRRRTIDAPLLTSIGGDVSMSAIRNDGPKAVPLGLSAVASVGGDITITVYDANPGVFAGLVSHTGNITIQGPPPNGNLDVNAAASFTSLTHVSGDVTVQNFYATNGMFNALQTVTGNVTVGSVRLYPTQSFSALTSISGDLHFLAMKEFGPPWPALQSVGGELSMSGQTTTSALHVLPVGAIAVEALRLENNAQLVDLTGTSFHVGAGPITIAGNPLLSQCAVNAFLAAQSAAGWTGAAVVSGTMPCP